MRRMNDAPVRLVDHGFADYIVDGQVDATGYVYLNRENDPVGFLQILPDGRLDGDIIGRFNDLPTAERALEQFLIGEGVNL